jgi:hypothetical protein
LLLFQKEVLSSCRCFSLKATWYNRPAARPVCSVLSGDIYAERAYGDRETAMELLSILTRIYGRD